jgi:hypothetical protein
MIIALIRFQPEFDETGILVDDESLGAHELILVPVEGAFEFAVLVQRADDEAVVVQVDASVLHQDADASDVAPVVKPPSVAQLLAEDFRRRFEVLDSNAGPELLVFSHPVPVLAVVGHILDVGVVIEVVRPVVAHRRHQHDVIDEIELEFIEADKVDNIGDDVAIGPRLVTKCIGKLVD